MEGTGAAAAATPPQALVPAPPARRGAGAAAPRGRLELAADALLCCFTGAMLVCFASCAAFMAARGACGRGSRAAAVAEELFLWSLLVGVLLLPLADLAQQLFVLFGRRNNEARVALVGGGARGRQDALRRSGTVPVFFVSLVCMAVGLLVRTLVPAKDSYMATAGYIVGDVGCFLHSVTFCFVLYPELLVQLRSIYAKLKED
ncbi:unnamed protein product [Urochloa decumbens]|uniref:Uncharacterized protein n=1 Tax=Urochloa decumbens TaxID=240449 RepID=A0ABC9BR27_9POAL